jgi:hypothetical protein
VEASVDDILRVCGAQAVQISLLQAEVARLSNVSTERRPLSDTSRAIMDKAIND